MSELMRRDTYVPSARARRKWEWKERQRGTLGKLVRSLLRVMLSPLSLAVPRTTTGDLRRSAKVAGRRRERRLARAAALEVV